MAMEREFQFYLRADLHKYEGRYIAIVGESIVASGDDSDKVIEDARKKTGKMPLLVKVPTEDTYILVLQWR